MLKKRIEKLEQVVPEQKKKVVIGVGARPKELGIDVFYIRIVPKQVNHTPGNFWHALK